MQETVHARPLTEELAGLRVYTDDDEDPVPTCDPTVR
jgi:hypothetical protein